MTATAQEPEIKELEEKSDSQKRVDRIKANMVVTRERPDINEYTPWAGFVHLKHVKVNPNQPRFIFEQEHLTSLSTSLKEIGQQRPLSVVLFNDESNPDIWFKIHDGECAFRSTKINGEKYVLVNFNPFVDPNDLMLQSLGANFCRAEHKKVELIEVVWYLTETKKMKMQEIADAIGKDVSYISHFRMFHNLIPELREKLDEKQRDNRLGWNLGLKISKAPHHEQMDLYNLTRGKTQKAAERMIIDHESGNKITSAAASISRNEVAVFETKELPSAGTYESNQANRRKPSDDSKIIEGWNKKAIEDTDWYLSRPPAVFLSLVRRLQASNRFDLYIKGLEHMISNITHLLIIIKVADQYIKGGQVAAQTELEKLNEKYNSKKWKPFEKNK